MINIKIYYPFLVSSMLFFSKILFNSSSYLFGGIIINLNKFVKKLADKRDQMLFVNWLLIV
jgi:hypothetical protein